MKKVVVLLSVIALCVSFMPNFYKATANSAQTYWEGVDSTGAIIIGEDCPLTVEKERLVFDIVDFPIVYGESTDYKTTVSAEYTFFNPTDMDLSIELAFPIGMTLQYENPNLENTIYKIEIDGEEIEKNVGYTYQTEYEFNQSDIDKATLLRASQSVIYGNSMLYSYNYLLMPGVYEICNSGDGEGGIVIASERLIRQKDNQKNSVFIEVDGKDDPVIVTIGVIGQKPEGMFLLDKSAVKHYHTKDVVEECLFQDFAYSLHEQEYGAKRYTKEEYLKAMIDVITVDSISSREADFYIGDRNFSWRVLSWFEYDMQVGAGQRVVNKVTAPILPAVDTSWNPAIYEYTYLLSPAKCWQSFGELEIIINTPYKIVKSEGYDFESIEGGYKLTLDSLPDGELKFTLSESQSPEKIKYKRGCFLNLYSEAYLIGLLCIVLAVIRIAFKTKQTVKK